MLKDEENARPTRDLKERSKRYSLEIIRMVTSLPRDRVADVLGRQVLRSATSVGANYREANRARSKAEFIAKVGDSLREAEESEYWLELLAESGTVPSANIAPLLQETRELLAILTAILLCVSASSIYNAPPTQCPPLSIDSNHLPSSRH